MIELWIAVCCQCSNAISQDPGKVYLIRQLEWAVGNDGVAVWSARAPHNDTGLGSPIRQSLNETDAISLHTADPLSTSDII